jgi:hypothetical protein
MRFLRASLLAGLLLPIAAYAANVPQVPGSMTICGGTGLPCITGGADGLAAYAFARIIPGLQYMFYAVAILFFFYYGVRLLTESDEENTVTETKQAYGYAIAGCVTVSMTGYLIQAIGPGFANSTLINDAPIAAGLFNVVLFLRLMVSAAVTGMIVYLGFRLILLQGKEDEMEQQKKRFFYGLLGVVVVLIADAIIRGFVPGAGGIGSSGLVVQIIGMINFMLELLGALAVLAFIVAGIMLVVSVDEGLKDRAKKAIFTTVIVMVIVLVSYVIVKLTVGITSA